MLFYSGLESIIFNRNQLFKCDELVVLSGYVGPAPVRRLKELPIKVTVIYGMYGCDGIQKGLHQVLVQENQLISNVDILYSTTPVHSKCYVWKCKGEVVHALIGSANFSTNGLTTPFKEVLAETTADTFDPLDKYIKLILTKTIHCEEAIVSQNKIRKKMKDTAVQYDRDVCSMPLYITANGIKTVPSASGINWGMSKRSGSHVNINDAYIKISADQIEHYPEMFPQKQESPSDPKQSAKEGHRHNDNVEIIWDDGETMVGLLEGSIPKLVNGKKENFPKQISTTPHKSQLGSYLRKRLGVSEGRVITMKDFQRYGRDTIDVSMQGEGIYYFDFSVNEKENDQPVWMENYGTEGDDIQNMVAEAGAHYGAER